MSFGETGIMIGDFQLVAYYGIILMLGAVAAAFLADFRARRSGMDSEKVWDGLIWVIIGGVIGARLWHIFTPPPSMVAQGITTEFYLTHPLDMLNIRNGGLGIPGAVIGGALALWFFCRRAKLSFLSWADLAAPTVALGQAIGRWGNYVNQEVYGAPTDLPWAITIDARHRLPEFASFEKYHPLFLYESIWSLLVLGSIFFVEKRFGKSLKPGDSLLIYLIGYPVGRFLLEFLRLDAAQIGGINFNQTFMLVIALLAAGALIWRHQPQPKRSRK